MICVNFNLLLQKQVADDISLLAFIEQSPALKKVADGGYCVCMFCKNKGGVSLGACLKKMKEGETTNGRTHLKSHEEEMKKLEEEERNKKRKHSPTLSDYGGFTAKKKAKKAISPSEANKAAKKAAQDGLHYRIFKFVNNGGHATSVINDPNFRDMIDFARSNQALLDGYNHLAYRKYVSIEFSSFNELLDYVRSKVEKIRKWYTDHTVSLLSYFYIVIT